MVVTVIPTEAQPFVVEIFSSCLKQPIFQYGVYGNDKLIYIDFLEMSLGRSRRGIILKCVLGKCIVKM
jgi:hypothetical protein